ncbi:MAG: cupin domain-containing protein [Clostridiales bacterium]|nr:cupin domain-containing protein [Candidatus Coliplasma equi]
MNVNDQIKQIAQRIKYLRDVLDMTEEQVASAVNVPIDEYKSYENGEKDIPISIIYGTAAALGVDPTELIVGEAPRMVEYCITRKDSGVMIERYPGYSFEALAHNFVGRDKEPMIVTLSASDKHADLVSHSGQEFNYVLEGTIGVTIGNRDFILSAGDSIYFDPSIPHGQYATEGTAKFLTIIDKD